MDDLTTKPLEIVYLPIEELSFVEYNPRTISQDKFEDLQRSIDELSVLEPAVINKRDGRNVIVSGNQRVRAAQQLGHTTYPCVVISVDLEQEKVINIRMNRSSGMDDLDALAELLTELPDELQELAGYDDEELAKLQDGWAETADDLPEAKEDKPKTTRFTIEELESRARVYAASGNPDRVALFISFLRQP